MCIKIKEDTCLFSFYNFILLPFVLRFIHNRVKTVIDQEIHPHSVTKESRNESIDILIQCLEGSYVPLRLRYFTFPLEKHHCIVV